MAVHCPQDPRRRNLAVVARHFPFWISFLLRVYAWIGLLNTNGVINNILMAIDVIDQPLSLIYNDFAVYLGIVYSYLPFMILPLYANLEKLDPAAPAVPPGLEVRKAGPEDRRHLYELADNIWHQQVQSPSWSPINPEFIEENRQAWASQVEEALGCPPGCW
jgi:hypothetical protein